MGLLIVDAELQQLFERNDLRITKTQQAFHIVYDDFHQRRTVRAAEEYLVELLFVLDEKKSGTTIVDDVFDLLDRVGRVDSIGDTADAEGPHVRIEPFGEISEMIETTSPRFNPRLFKPRLAHFERSPYSFHVIGFQMPKSFSRMATASPRCWTLAQNNFDTVSQPSTRSGVF